jgi:hypothetical protein
MGLLIRRVGASSPRLWPPASRLAPAAACRLRLVSFGISIMRRIEVAIWALLTSPVTGDRRLIVRGRRAVVGSAAGGLGSRGEAHEVVRGARIATVRVRRGARLGWMRTEGRGRVRPWVRRRPSSGWAQVVAENRGRSGRVPDKKLPGGPPPEILGLGPRFGVLASRASRQSRSSAFRDRTAQGDGGDRCGRVFASPGFAQRRGCNSGHERGLGWLRTESAG